MIGCDDSSYGGCQSDHHPASSYYPFGRQNCLCVGRDWGRHSDDFGPSQVDWHWMPPAELLACPASAAVELRPVAVVLQVAGLRPVAGLHLAVGLHLVVGHLQDAVALPWNARQGLAVRQFQNCLDTDSAH